MICLLFLWTISAGIAFWLRLSLPWLLLILYAVSCFLIVSAPNGMLVTLAAGSFAIMRKRGHTVRMLGPGFWRGSLFAGLVFIIQITQVPLVIALTFAALSIQDRSGLAFFALGFMALYTAFYFYGMTAYCGWLLQKKEMFICEKFLYRRG